MPSRAHACYACGKRIRPGLLMCAHHWSRVPKEIRMRVYSTWTAFNRHADLDTLAAYREAIDAARAAALGREVAHG